MPVIFYPASDKLSKVSFLFNKHKSLLWHHTVNGLHILHNIVLKWEVTLLGTSTHCPPLSSHTCTQNSTQHYWYLNEYFSSLSFLTIKIYTYPWKQTWNVYQPPPSTITRSKSRCWGCTGTSQLSKVYGFTEFSFLESLKKPLNNFTLHK